MQVMRREFFQKYLLQVKEYLEVKWKAQLVPVPYFVKNIRSAGNK